MKKLILSLVVFCVMVDFAFAKSSLSTDKGFVGIQGGFMRESNVIGINNYEGVIKEEDFSHMTFGIKGGIEEDGFRMYGEFNHNFEAVVREIDQGYYLGYHYVDSKSIYKISSNEFISGADFYITKVSDINIFAGAFLGLEVRTYTKEVKEDDESIERDAIGVSLLFGAKLGGIYEIDAHNNIEFGARLSKGFLATQFAGFAGYTYKF